MRGARRPVVPLESQSQAAYFDWWASFSRTQGIPQHLCFAVPNGAFLAGDPRRRAMQMARLKEQGLTPGVSDVFLLVPAAGFHALLIEFKRQGEKPSDAQANFLYDVRRRGYNAMVVYSTEEAIKVVRAYLGKP